MADLKTVRNRLGLNQADLARKLNTSVPMISNFESGVVIPDVESMVILEVQLDTSIDWRETLTESDKAEVVNCFVELATYYPLSSVLNFIQKALKDGQKMSIPTKIIEHYTEQAHIIHMEPLMYPNSFVTKKQIK